MLLHPPPLPTPLPPAVVLTWVGIGVAIHQAVLSGDDEEEVVDALVDAHMDMTT